MKGFDSNNSEPAQLSSLHRHGANVQCTQQKHTQIGFRRPMSAYGTPSICPPRLPHLSPSMHHGPRSPRPRLPGWTCSRPGPPGSWCQCTPGRGSSCWARSTSGPGMWHTAHLRGEGADTPGDYTQAANDAQHGGSNWRRVGLWMLRGLSWLWLCDVQPIPGWDCPVKAWFEGFVCECCGIQQSTFVHCILLSLFIFDTFIRTDVQIVHSVRAVENQGHSGQKALQCLVPWNQSVLHDTEQHELVHIVITLGQVQWVTGCITTSVTFQMLVLSSPTQAPPKVDYNLRSRVQICSWGETFIVPLLLNNTRRRTQRVHLSSSNISTHT